MLCKIQLATALRSTPPQEVLPSRAERNDGRHGQSGVVSTRRRGQRRGINPQGAQHWSAACWGRWHRGAPYMWRLRSRATCVKQAMRDKLIAHRHYINRHGEDMPEICHCNGASRRQPPIMPASNAAGQAGLTVGGRRPCLGGVGGWAIPRSRV